MIFDQSNIKKNSVLLVDYAEKPRLCIVLRKDETRRDIKLRVKFYDNGENRKYSVYDRRIKIATPVEIVKYKEENGNFVKG